MDQQWYALPKKRGSYITLISVLVATAVSLSVGVSLILWGTGFTKTSLSLKQSHQAKALADACAEEALQQIQDSGSFTGSATVSLGQGSCSYTVTSLGAQDRLLTTSGTVGDAVRRIQISIDQVSPIVNVTSWQEVVSF
ncbi:MAG TPA: hypothetical protein VI794_01750 [Patescibacteria group bacterium]|nr:hypothetical protein [Patescibacteria group bacterium]